MTTTLGLRYLALAGCLIWLAGLATANPQSHPQANIATAAFDKGVLGPDLEITKSCDSSGARPICTVTVRNLSSVTAVDVTVVEDPPEGTFARRVGSCFGDEGLAAPVPIDNVSLGNVLGNEVLVCNFEMSGQAGVGINFVEVTSISNEIDASNNTDTAPFVISVLSIPTLNLFGFTALVVILAIVSLLWLRRWGF